MGNKHDSLNRTSKEVCIVIEIGTPPELENQAFFHKFAKLNVLNESWESTCPKIKKLIFFMKGIAFSIEI